MSSDYLFMKLVAKMGYQEFSSSFNTPCFISVFRSLQVFNSVSSVHISNTYYNEFLDYLKCDQGLAV